jgi:protease-4
MNLIKTIFSPISKTMLYIQNHFKAMLFLLLLFLIFSSEDESFSNYNLSKIYLSDEIVNVENILEKIEKAKNNSNVKGVLFIVDSPGGSVPPSIELAYAIKNLNKIKPVVTYAAGTIASGSYYASIWSSEIVVNPGSIVGSIGVIMQGMNIEKLIKKIGISTQTVKIGTYKESGTFTREWTKEERSELQRVISKTYEMFIGDVASARKLDINKHKEYADAHIFTARTAQKIGLIDKVGVISDAQDRLIVLSKVKVPVWQKKDKVDKMLEQFESRASSKITAYFQSSLKSILFTN